MEADIEQVLISRERIAQRIEELARQITDDLRPKGGREDAEDPGDAEDSAQITLVPILTGSIIFVSDLIRRLPLPMRIGLVSVSSYPGRATASQGARLDAALGGLPTSLEGSHVLVLDDILDSGGTLKLVCDLIRQRRPASLRTCVLLRKQRPEALSFPVDYVAFDIPDVFVVGYGLDLDGYYRNLPDIVTLKPQVYGNGRLEGSKAQSQRA